MVYMDKPKILVGIDEAGRGPLAGPVAVGVCVCDTKMYASYKRTKKLPTRDSKKLTEKKREEWFTFIQECKKNKSIDYTVSLISASFIDTHGISMAIKTGISRSLKKLGLKPDEVLVLLDGGLKADREYVHQKTIIKGDEKEPIISLASIVAKVTRDRYMKKIAKKFPEYGLETHKGYGTRSHYEALKKKGLSQIHRRSFLKKIA